MKDKDESIEYTPDKLALNVAIMGGGRACKFFLGLLQNNPFPFLDMKIVGVCDINPDAEGLRMAQEMGIYTTQDFRDLLKIKNLDSVIEVTGNRGALLELIRHRPKGVGVIEHNIGRLLRGLLMIDQSLKNAQQQLFLKDMITDFMMQQTNQPVVILSPDFTISEANEAYLKSVDKPRNEVIGAHCYEVSHGLSVPCSSWMSEIGCPLEETMRTGQSAHKVQEHLTAGDNIAYCDMITYPIKNANGEIVRVIEICRDVTEELSSRITRRVEEVTADMGKLIQEDRMISLGKLVASCVHEINNPIQGLLTFCRLMEEIMAEGEPGPTDLEQFRMYLSLMSSELERCGDIVSGLLSFSRECATEFKHIDLNEVLGSVFSLTRHKMELQNIDLDERLSSMPLIIYGDVNQMQQCFLNLIFNAFEAMPQGGRLSVSSRLDTAKKCAHLEIQDTGSGIPDEELSRVFDPFFTTKGEGKGTGLGLSIVYGVVKSHKGDVKVKSELGKGSVFTLTFPIE
ncbi:MAG: PAS domain-containing protein [Proteobacteria bacterium]|nr:PAS domain-containing protein [Pseudomonadota bacterium]